MNRWVIFCCCCCGFVFVFCFLFFFWGRLLLFQVGPEFVVYLRITLNSWSSRLYFPRAEATSVCRYIQGGEYLFFSNLTILNIGEAKKWLEFLHITDKDANSNQPGKRFVSIIHCESAVPFLGLQLKRNSTVWSHRVSTGTLWTNHQRLDGKQCASTSENAQRWQKRNNNTMEIPKSVGLSEKSQKQRVSKCLVSCTCNSRKGKAPEWKSVTPRAGERDKDGLQNARVDFVGWCKCLYWSCRGDYTATSISFHLRP